MGYKNSAGTWRCAQAVLLALCCAPSAFAADNLKFKGVLVEGACIIRPGDEEISLEFRRVTNKYLYLNTRTLGERFELKLEECDTAIADSVTITFSGTPNAQLPGLLALSGSSTASGVGIGIETLQGKPLPLGSASDKHFISNGSHVIALAAYVKGEPQAIANKTIGMGELSAVSTFVLNYN